MKPHKKKETIFRSASDCYRKLALIDLIKRIAELGDKRALAELHNNRTCFRIPDKGWGCLSDYLNHLREMAANMRWKPGKAFEIADRAYELALEKFSNLPKRTISEDIPGSDHDILMKRKDTDCRLYYKAYFNFIRRELKDRPPKGLLDEELILAKEFQKFVTYHFHKALLEAKRNSNPFWSRYFWEVNGRKICLWMPKYIYGHQRRRWLERNIHEPDPLKPNERERIQDIINHKITYLAFLPLNENKSFPEDKRFKPEEIGTEPFCQALPQAVAEEKAANIKRQRRAIQKLGMLKLKRLILKIFESLDDSSTLDRELAKEFGLSKATFSRFAGSRWHNSETGAIPDLWRNTSHVLAMNPDFKATVIAAGAWKQVQTTLTNSTKKQG